MSVFRPMLVPLLLAGSLLAQVTPAAEKAPVAAPSAPPPSVSVMFSAIDSHGNPVRKLAKDQVSILENNQTARTLDVQDASALPLDLGIVLLASKKKFDQEQAAAIALVQKVVRPGTDRVFVVTAGGEKPWPSPRLDWESDPAAIARTIHGLDKDAGLPDAFNYRLEVARSGLDRMPIQHWQESGFSVFDVIWKMMSTDPRPVRRAVMIFRLASQHSPGMGNQVTQSIEATHQRVITAAQALGVAMYAIGLEDPLPSVNSQFSSLSQSYTPTYAGEGTATRDYDEKLNRTLELQANGGRSNVDRIADETGGRSYWTNKKNFSDAVTGIANELSARWVVSFAPPAGPASGQVHSLKVQVSDAAHVSAPHAYVAADSR